MLDESDSFALSFSCVPREALGGVRIVLVTVSIAMLLLLGACGDKPQSASPGPIGSPATSSDPLAPRYAATLSEGIDFRKPGYPEFVAEIAGISAREDWGRWSDANLGSSARIRFRQALPGTSIVEITANAFGPNLGNAIVVRIGKAEQSFIHADPSRPATYVLKFEGLNGADVIEIIPPKPVSPAEFARAADTRRVGVGLVSLRIRP